MGTPFYIVDVFAEEKYSGNQLAVVRDAGDLQDTVMQKIAKEMNYSETTFILSNDARDGGYDVRIFTPEMEVPFAGHPTLGTAYVIQREIIGRPVDIIILNLKVGRIPVYISYIGDDADILWMRHNPPIFGRVLSPGPVSRVLGLDVDDIDDRYPIQEVSTGLPFLIIPLKSLEAVRQAHIDRDLYFELIRDLDAKALLIFCPETYDPRNDLNVRVFADYYGVPEDPATGSANGCLASYLVRYKYFGSEKVNVRVEQGYEVGRPSLLLLRGEFNEGGIDVYVGGRVQMIARGELI